MKLTVYKCDACKEVLSDDAVKTQHLCIKGQILLPTPNDKDRWNYSPNNCVFKEGEFHFCSSQCFGNWVFKQEQNHQIFIDPMKRGTGKYER